MTISGLLFGGDSNETANGVSLTLIAPQCTLSKHCSYCSQVPCRLRFRYCTVN